MRPDGQAPYTCVRNCARPSVHTVTKLTEPASQPAAEPAPGYQHRTHVQLGRYHAHCALFTPLTKHAHMRINAPRAVPACHHRICLICMRRTSARTCRTAAHPSDRPTSMGSASATAPPAGPPIIACAALALALALHIHSATHYPVHARPPGAAPVPRRARAC